MSWCWKLGKLAGITVQVHWTFLILIAWTIYAYGSSTQNLADTIEGVLFIFALFGCVVLHELGHALAARGYGIETEDITLLPIGGLARLKKIPEEPREELVVALAGPAVNLVIVLGLTLGGISLPILDSSSSDWFLQTPFLAKLLAINLMLLTFNLLPAFPMDGGRVLRALLAMRMDHARATRIAASIGQFMAILFGFLGLSAGQPFLLLIALFVWIGAESEAAQTAERVIFSDAIVENASLRDYQTLRPEDSLEHASALLLEGSQHDFPVLDGRRPLGVLARGQLIAGLAKEGRHALVRDWMTSGLECVAPEDPLLDAVNRLRASGSLCMLVRAHDQDSHQGLLTLENAGEYFLVQVALMESSNPR